MTTPCSVLLSAPVALALALLAPLAAQTAGGVNGTDWTDLTAASAARPSARLMHGLVYDSGRDRCVLFGGSTDGTAATFDDTWELAGNTWSNMGTLSPRPPVRMGHSMVFANDRGQTILFGGSVDGSTVYNDTWTWDGVAWADLAPSNPPPARMFAAMTYASSWGGILLFGGANAFGGARSNDTWFLNALTATWTKLTPATNPPPMHGASLTFDQARGYAVLVGRTFSSTEQEIWEFDLTTWTRRNTASGPVPRGGVSIAYDHLRHDTLLFAGGWSGIGVQGDTWEWNGATWTERVPLHVPGAREWHTIAWDTFRHRGVLFGGWSGNLGLGARGDTWQYAYGCDVVGPGHLGGGLPITCTTPPRLGTSFCVQFPAATGLGAVLVGLQEPLLPGVPVSPPLFCAQGALYTLGGIALDTSGSPATTCIAIPANPVLLWGAVTLQGVVIDTGPCVRLTDGLVVVLQP